MICQMKFFGEYDFYNKITSECEATAVCVAGYVLSTDVNKCLSVVDGSLYVPPPPVEIPTCSQMSFFNNQTNTCECYNGYLRNAQGVCEMPPSPASIPNVTSEDKRITIIILFLLYLLLMVSIVVLFVQHILGLANMFCFQNYNDELSAFEIKVKK